MTGSIRPVGPSRFWGWVLFVVMVAALYMIFIYAPTERQMGDIQRLFYFHVGAAWNAFFAFFVVFIMSLLYLKTRSTRWDVIALSSAEIGVIFTTIVLVTGPIWGKAYWGHWWTWDPRLTTTLILWFIYVAYLVIRSSAEGENRARFAAVFGIIGFVDVPIVFLSIHWWRTIHPKVIDATGINMEPEMVITLLVSVAAFTLLYFYLLSQRVAIETTGREVSRLRDRLRTRAGL